MHPEYAGNRIFAREFSIDKKLVQPKIGEVFYDGRFLKDDALFATLITSSLSFEMKISWGIPTHITTLVYVDLRTEEQIPSLPSFSPLPDVPSGMYENDKAATRHDHNTILRVMFGGNPHSPVRKTFGDITEHHPGSTLVVMSGHGTYPEPDILRPRTLGIKSRAEGAVGLSDALHSLPSFLEHFGILMDDVPVVHLRMCNPSDIMNISDTLITQKDLQKKEFFGRSLPYDTPVSFASSDDLFAYVPYDGYLLDSDVLSANGNTLGTDAAIYRQCQYNIRLINTPYENTALSYALSTIRGASATGRAITRPDGTVIMSA